MNNIFKVIWNHATQTWTAVGELASAKGKSKSVKLAAISTALLAVVAGGAQAAQEVVTKAEDRGGLAIGTTTVSAQFYGNKDYTDKTGLTENKVGAKVNAYDGIAIGNGALSGSNSGTAGNAHIAIGLMSQATGNTANGKVGDGANAQNAAVALGAYSLATGQGGTAIGAHAVASDLNSTALGKIAHANGASSTAVGQQSQAVQRATATGAESKALAPHSTAVGERSKVNSGSSIAVGSNARVETGSNSAIMGSNSEIKGDGIAAVGANTKIGKEGSNEKINNVSSVGYNTTISSSNVSTLGSNINVGEGRDGAVVLGHGSDAGGDSVVTAVNSATAAGSPLIYKGFAGNLGDKSKDATNSEASNQGRIVSVGDDTKKIQVTTEVSNGTKTTTTVIKNLITKEVTEIVETSTIANGKNTITKVVNDITDPNNKKVKIPSKTEVKNTKEKPYQDSAKQVGPEKTIYGERQIQHVAAGEITEGSTNAINGSQLYQVAKTLGTAAKGLADTLGVDLNEDGTVKNKFSQPLTVAEGSDYTAPAAAGDVKTALNNLNDYVNAGWKVATPSTSEDKGTVSIGHTVNFVGLGNVDVDGEFNNKNGTHNINISVDSPLDYASTKAEVEVGGKKVDVDVVKANDGKWYPKDQVDEDNNPKDGAKSIPSSDIVKKGAKLTDSDTENNPYEKGNAYTYDDKGNITATGYDKTKPESKDEITAGKNGVQLNNVGWATQPDQAVNKDQLDQTVNKSGFFVKNNGKDVATKDSDDKEISPKDKVTPNDAINFANGDGTVVNVKTVRDENGVDTTTVSVDVDAAKVIDKVKGNVTAAKVDGDEAGKVTVANADKGKLATVDTVKDAINSSFWTARVENNDKQVVKTANNSANATIKAGSNVAFVAGKNLVANQTTTGDNTVFTYGLASEIEVDKITVKAKAGEADKGTTVENGKVTNLDDHLTAPEKVAADKAKVANATVVSSAPISGNGNEAATVNDVLNAGWNLKTNGNQTAAITNGKGLDFTSSDNSVTITPTVDDKGNAKVNVAVNTTNVINGVKGNVTAAKVDGDEAGKVTVANADKGKLATVDTVKDAINSSFWTARVENNDKQVVKTANNSANATIKAGSNVAFVAGKNLVANQTTTGDNTVFTYGLASEIEVDKITVKAKAGEADKGTTVENGKVTNLDDHLTAPEKVAADKAKVANATVVSSAPI
uniref:ESPR-type extended signal peptide-containing protein n=2 Tax=Haemophilus haemolyticus TaxID=726 RepID=UPI0012900FF9